MTDTTTEIGKFCVSVHELERRLRPQRHTSDGAIHTDAEEQLPPGLTLAEGEEVPAITYLRAMRSSVGFLGSVESLLERIRLDKAELAELGISHETIAGHLTQILNQADALFQSRQCTGGRALLSVELWYDSQTYSQQFPTPAPYPPQKLVVTHLLTRGDVQLSPFSDLRDLLEHPERELDAWSDEYLVTHVDLGLSLRLGGNTRHGVINFIRDYAFFEGEGDENSPNPFRISPSKVVSILSGQWLPKAVDHELLLLGAAISKQRKELDEISTQQSEARRRLSELAVSSSADSDAVEMERDDLESQLIYLKEVSNEAEGALLQLQQLRDKLKSLRLPHETDQSTLSA